MEARVPGRVGASFDFARLPFKAAGGGRPMRGLSYTAEACHHDKSGWSGTGQG
jgi:hypothetical protein